MGNKTHGHLLFERLKSYGLVEKGAPAAQFIGKMGVSKMVDAANAMSELADTSRLVRERGTFAHFASTSLSGAPYPCASLDCRLKRVDSLAQFASLYSDTVYFYDLFDSIRSNWVASADVSAAELQRDLRDAVEILLRVQPLIEAGVLVPVAPPCLCSKCLSKMLGEKAGRDRFLACWRKLKDDVERGIQGQLIFDGDRFVIEITGPEEFVEHGRAIAVTTELPREIREASNLKQRCLSGKPTNLSRKSMRAFSLPQDIANPVMSSLATELSASHCLATSYVTERPLDISLLARLGQDPTAERINSAIHRHASSLVPLVDTLDYRKLLRLRKEEGEAFVQFRASLKKAVKEYTARGEELTEALAREIYGDVIQPQLSNIEGRMRVARKGLLKDVCCSAAAWTAAISVGTCAGVLTGDVASVAAALGMTGVVAEVMAGALRRANFEDELKQEDMYFLWKAGKKAVK